MPSSDTLGEYHLDYWTRESFERNFVYVIQGEPGTPYKIGVAIDVRKRLGTLQTGNPQTLRLLHVVPALPRLERLLHRHLSRERVRGEWFAGPVTEEAVAYVSDLADFMVDRHRTTGRTPAPGELRPPWIPAAPELRTIRA